MPTGTFSSSDAGALDICPDLPACGDSETGDPDADPGWRGSGELGDEDRLGNEGVASLRRGTSAAAEEPERSELGRRERAASVAGWDSGGEPGSVAESPPAEAGATDPASEAISDHLGAAAGSDQATC